LARILYCLFCDLLHKPCRMNFDTAIGLAASLCTIIPLLPRLIKIYELKKPVAQSSVTTMVTLTGIILWVGYGIIKSDMIIATTNTVSLIISVNFYILNSLYLKQGSTELALHKPRQRGKNIQIENTVDK
jgi:MtN3 and saliva related transmembrane protein